MKKDDFLKKLKIALKNKLTKAEISEIILDYTEYFDVGIADGKTEEELIMQFGDPKIIAMELLSDKKSTARKFNLFSVNNIFRLFAFILFVYLIYNIIKFNGNNIDGNFDFLVVLVLPILLILSDFKSLINVRIKSFAIKHSTHALIALLILLVAIGALMILFIYFSINWQYFLDNNKFSTFNFVIPNSYNAIMILFVFTIILIVFASLKWSNLIGLLFYPFGAVVTTFEIRKYLSYMSGDYQISYDAIKFSCYAFALGIILTIVSIVFLKLYKRINQLKSR